ncbi:glutathione S-transferase family protein [Novosphingobium sp. ERN07]|uniref:glutathione S-transferase family protein n=1 Tax=Novosphingobium sp. ERN07 TaxID=2726187 RepID=UPI001456B610|nr:glutathione S-transferase family protein [Novosphingobium sp. ERN07]NLR72232.1 glutathione S-transferase family protein [Novosphingobium sp. ERN07]
MSAILYHGEPNGASLTVLAALAESGLAIECRHIDLLAGERHALPGISDSIALDLGIEGEGPVLVADGEAMTESVFLAQYLDEAAGGAGLQPTDAFARWEMMMWCRQITERLSPAAALLGNVASAQAALAAIPAEGFADITASIASDDLRERWQALHDGRIDAAQIADSEAKVAAAVERCEKQLVDGRDWLMGSFSIADLVTYSWLAAMEPLLPQAFTAAPRTQAWLARTTALPCIQAAFARATVPDPLRAWAPGPEINRWG